MNKKSIAQCPACNNKLLLSSMAPSTPSTPSTPPGGNWSKVHQLNSTAPTGIAGPVPDDFQNYDRTHPVRPATIQSEVVVPLLLSVSTGTIGLGVIAIGGLILGYDPGTALKAAAVGGTIITAVVWVSKLGLHEKLLVSIESIRRDNQANTPPPDNPTTEIAVSLTSTNGNGQPVTERFHLPSSITEHKFLQFCRNADRNGLAEKNWIGRGKLFSSSEYAAILTALQTPGLIAWVDDDHHAQGRKITAKGRATLTGIARTRAHARTGPAFSHNTPRGEGGTTNE